VKKAADRTQMTRIFTFILTTLLVVATPVRADHTSAVAAGKSASKAAKTHVTIWVILAGESKNKPIP
jgi:hypothetical protein